ncbi:hypothetical protein E2562_012198 [Oryza meyeriana var. granulata]|uniref:Uncharacterized protein n=1 Tax=Oryza meyeriana var. granulata TaxID=110450 RepID=A0A6G1F7G8_9ORYZ|nr:hypothetical protein E2562_012198 [Oryza meyeriana var. granulata]
MLALHIKLSKTTKALRQWGQRAISEIRQQLLISQEIVLRLDAAQDNRLLSPAERWLRSALKGRALALASLDRIRIRQRARLQYIKEGDTNSRFFHLKCLGGQCVLVQALRSLTAGPLQVVESLPGRGIAVAAPNDASGCPCSALADSPSSSRATARGQSTTTMEMGLGG